MRTTTLRSNLSPLSLVALLAVGSAVPIASAQTDADTTAAPDTTTAQTVRVPFGPGERFVFSIDYGFINAGEGVLSVLGMVDDDGHRCYEIESTARSNGFFSSFYKVRDRVISHMDAEGLFSRYFQKRLREGDYKKTVEVRFDQDAGKAVYDGGRSFDIVRGVQDVLSAFYYVRTLDLAVGHDVFFSAHSSKKTYDMRVIVLGREEVKTDLGTFDCFVVQPIMIGEGLFKQEGDLVIYLTADDRRMPVLMKTKLPVGSIAANLKEYTLAPPAGGTHD